VCHQRITTLFFEAHQRAQPPMRRNSTSWEFNNSINSLKSRVSFIRGGHDFEHETELFVAGQRPVIRIIGFIRRAKVLVDLKFALGPPVHDEIIRAGGWIGRIEFGSRLCLRRLVVEMSQIED
jgi:hypothetical protein